MIDHKLEKLYPEIKYTINFIFETLGYNYKYINNLGQLSKNDVFFTYAEIEPSFDEVKTLSAGKILTFVPADPDLLNIGMLNTKAINSYKKKLSVNSDFEIISKKDFADPFVRTSNGKSYYGKLSFDIIGNIFFNIASYEQRNSRKKDELGRISDSASSFNLNAKVPYVNELLFLLDNIIKDSYNVTNRNAIRKQQWPKAENQAVCLTHDVSYLSKWSISSFIGSFFTDLLILPYVTKSIPSLFEKFKFLFTNDEPYWNFEVVDEIYKKYSNLKASYFFSSIKNSKLEADYSLKSKDVTAVINTLTKNKHEVALLASTESNDKRTQLSKEINDLNKIVKKEKLGVKQNHSKIVFDNTAKFQDTTNVLYSNSQAMLSKNGFYNGIAYPYKRFILSEKTESSSYEIPVTFNDEQLFVAKNRKISFDDATASYKELSKNITGCGGVMCYNFNIANFYENKYLAKLLESIIQHEKGKNVYFSTVANIAKWWQKRSEVTVNEHPNGFDIAFTKNFENFSVELINKQNIEIENAEFELINNNLVFSNINAGQTIKVRYTNEEISDNN